MSEIEIEQQAPSAVQPPSESTGSMQKALTGIELLREKVRANGDLSGRLRDLEAVVADVRRQSQSIPAVDPAVRNAIQKVNGRLEKLESTNGDLIAALTSINQKVGDLERLVCAFSQITDGI